jgi:hypothetical protein|tara:strand:+ start:2684 stop:2911 length:228 start_codon:yes stop_codon:yes gene_type:complete
MIQQPIEVSDEFLDDVKTFCLKNNIEWGNVYSECWLDGVSGTPEQVKKVENYVKYLEKKRNEFRLMKSFWWRLWN